MKLNINKELIKSHFIDVRKDKDNVNVDYMSQKAIAGVRHFHESY